ncbi:ubiquinone biosynthesis protein [Rhodoligotrophos appendicifer]|uniref:2-polyprenylphenol 6-hydroxylase n=1 Tax=Rhodoligotrophos appendicifer TaxID=987056 RepID=UPI00117DE7E6|nr:2-polyprenylphenol 6-hydroxylase [Rhodoligotrophos appendicifer]
MATRIGHIMTLFGTMWVLARHDAFAGMDELPDLPAPARTGLRLMRRLARKKKSRHKGLAPAIVELGPSYIKLGQFLATRADIVGTERAAELSELQDRLPPFSRKRALQEIRQSLGSDPALIFEEIGPPIAAASIAQVHKATIREFDGTTREVAVKVLRPGIEGRFARDLDSFFFAARWLERHSPPARRLRPVQTVETLAQSVKLEMDLRMEAAAISEIAENTVGDPGFRVPRIDWERTGRRVLTTEWIDGTPLSDIAALRERGVDFVALGETIIQSFLRHAIRDGFFHADMHQGNLFVDHDGLLVAVDFGITGRLSLKDRRFLAEILWGFINRNYRRVAEVHFEAGYVPADQSTDLFAQALRAIGEPLMGKQADQISMARVLGQLFTVTEQFNMATQPQLLLLQKTMVVVEGVARSFNPQLNMWDTAEPVVRRWAEEHLGPSAYLHDAAEGAALLGRVFGNLPELFNDAERTARMLSAMADAGGIKLDRTTSESLAAAGSRHDLTTRMAIWIGALALVALAVSQFV